MDQVRTPQRKALVVRGTQMLVIGVMMNIGVTIIGFLALVQFFWMMFASERNSSVTDLGVNISEWCSHFDTFLSRIHRRIVIASKPELFI